jgi:hypothetical protein
MNGKQLEAGTSSPGVFICLIGENGRSGKLYLQSHLSLLKRGATQQSMLDDMFIECSDDLGEISVVILGIEGSIFHYSWYVNEVGLYNLQSKKLEAFPCYHWIRHGDSATIVAKTGKYYYLLILDSYSCVCQLEKVCLCVS